MGSKEPNLNPLDFSIWSILETRVLATPHTSHESLRAKLQREWEAIPQEQMRAVCDAFVKRLKAISRSTAGTRESEEGRRSPRDANIDAPSIAPLSKPTPVYCPPITARDPLNMRLHAV
ncbi:hypothetical protein FHG87_003792 [Trinorchestia longiramus]|nr:hypothetical protein FHG87_003792 [Trinorchestia longiramus]